VQCRGTDPFIIEACNVYGKRLSAVTAETAPSLAPEAAFPNALFNGKATKETTPTSPIVPGSTLWPRSTASEMSSE